MACFKPLTAWIAHSGEGKLLFKISLQQQESRCYKKITLACGKCIGCRIQHGQQLAVRTIHEAKFHERKCCITLTYDEYNVQTSLDYKDAQDFLKRLRERLSRQYNIKIRYIIAGEYGSKSERIHWHAVIYGYDFHHDRKKYKKSPSGDQMWNSELLDKTWGKGHATIQNFSEQGARYIASYLVKDAKSYSRAQQVEETLDTNTGEITKRRKEFAKWSTQPPLGHKWIEKYHQDIYNTLELRLEGQFAGIPKYYRKWMDKNNPVAYAPVADRANAYAYKNADNCTPERLAIREEVQILKQQQRKRSL